MAAKQTTAEKLADLRERLDKAQDPGSERSRKRRDEAGRTTPRQRINELLDEGSFVETGSLGKTPGDPDAIPMAWSPAMAASAAVPCVSTLTIKPSTAVLSV